MHTALQLLIRYALSDPAQFTTQTIADALKQSDNDLKPEFLRLPESGQQCPFTGLTRAYMNTLVLPTKENGFKPLVRSFTLRKRGKARGVRLVDCADLVRYIREHVEPSYQDPAIRGDNYEI